MQPTNNFKLSVLTNSIETFLLFKNIKKKIKRKEEEEERPDKTRQAIIKILKYLFISS